jgi:O-antigen/teichoic acid export membrane protein
MPEAMVSDIGSKKAAAAGPSLLRTGLANMSQLSLAMAITMPLGLVIKIMVPRVLGTEMAGILFFAETFPMLVLSFIPMGIPFYIQKAVPPRHEHAVEIFSTVAIFSGLVAGLAVLTLIAFMGFAGHDPLTIRVTGIMACTQAIAIICNDFIQRIYLATGRVTLSSVVNVTAKLATTLLVLLCLWLRPELMWIAATLLAAQTLVLAGNLLKSWQIGLMAGRFDLTLLKRMLRIGLPFLFGGVLATINASICTISLERLATFEELGFYGASQRLLGVLLLLTPLLGQAFGPTLSRLFAYDRAAYATVASTIVRGIVVVSLPLALGLILFRLEIIDTLFGAQFMPAHYALAAAGPVLIIVYLSSFVGISASTATSGKYFALVLAIGATLNACGNWLLIPIGVSWLGAGGAAAGAMAATIIATGSDAYLLSKISGVKIVDRRASHAIMVGLSLAALCCATLNFWDSLSLGVRIATFITIVPTLIFALRVVSLEDIRAIREAVRRRQDTASA